MSTFTITSSSIDKLFGFRHRIENDMGISLSYRTGMILGSTSFYKQDVLWFTIMNKGELNIDGRQAGVIKNKCAPQDGRAVIATITSAEECSKAVVVPEENKKEKILFFKDNSQIAVAQGDHNKVLVDLMNPDDLLIALVLGWCSLHHVFMKVWDRIEYFEPAPDQPKVQDRTSTDA